jgi:hypothetical protein
MLVRSACLKQTLPKTLQNRKKKFAPNEKFCAFRNYLCIAKHDSSVVRGSKQSGEQISKTKRSRFIGFELFPEMHILFDMVYVVSAFGMHMIG